MELLPWLEVSKGEEGTEHTLIMATKGMTLFMYFFSSGRAPSSLAITLLSGSAPLLLWTDGKENNNR